MKKSMLARPTEKGEVRPGGSTTEKFNRKMEKYRGWPPDYGQADFREEAREGLSESAQLILRVNKLSALSKCLGMSVSRQRTILQEPCREMAGKGDVCLLELKTRK